MGGMCDVLGSDGLGCGGGGAHKQRQDGDCISPLLFLQNKGSGLIKIIPVFGTELVHNVER
jgi:hypothetical protein